MDSLTQAALGGVVAYAVLGPSLGKRAVIYGMALGTLPDLDVLIDFGGPIENMTHHRGFTNLIIDAIKGGGGMFSLDNGTGQRFLTRSEICSIPEG